MRQLIINYILDIIKNIDISSRKWNSVKKLLCLYDESSSLYDKSPICKNITITDTTLNKLTDVDLIQFFQIVICLTKTKIIWREDLK